MHQPRLRVFFGPQNEPEPALQSHAAPDTVTVALGEVFPLLADAIRAQRTWLRDFEDDEITISSDLYDVIMAYQHYHRPSA